MTAARDGSPAWGGVIAEFSDWLPLTADDDALTLGEGGTPLVRSRWLSEQTGCDVWLKLESANPTGSFKDRGMVVAVAGAVGSGARAVVCASTGNTSASMAAYAARAGLTAIVLAPAGGVAPAKLAQAVAHGARIVQMGAGFDGCLRVARRLADRYPVALVNSVNPLRLEGQKTAAFEIVDALGRAPDLHVLPVGNAGNISAYWKGFVEYCRAGRCAATPRMLGIQARGAAPLVLGEPVADPDTVASAIRIGNPASWALAIAARDESGGLIRAVPDGEIVHAQQNLARLDGVFVEPASAAAAAGLLACHRAGDVAPASLVSVTLTGHGLKDVASEAAGDPEAEQQTVVGDDDRAVERVADLAGLVPDEAMGQGAIGR